MPALTMFEVTPDHPVPISPQGGTATVTVLSGDTLYYADTPQVSAAHNQGSVTAGNVQSFTNPAWVRSASLSTVLAQVTAATVPTASLPGSVALATSPQGDPLNRTQVLGTSTIAAPSLRQFVFADDLPFGAVGDAHRVTDGAITAGTNQLSSATASFKVGQVVEVVGAGPGGTNFNVSAYVGSVTAGVASLVTTSGGSTPKNASVTVTGATVTYGTDDSAAINAATAAVSAAGGGHVHFTPLKTYWLSKHSPPSNVTYRGNGATFYVMPLPADGANASNAIASSTLGSQNVTFREMTWAGHGQEVHNQWPFLLSGMINVRFYECEFSTFTIGAINASDVTGIRVVNCTFANVCAGYPPGGSTTGNPLNFIPAANSATYPLTDIYVTGCRINGFIAEGIDITPGSLGNPPQTVPFKATIVGNNVTGAAAAGTGIGLELGGTGVGTYPAQDIVIANNNLTNCNIAGIQQQPSATLLSRCVIAGNTVNDPSTNVTTGINWAGSYATITGNVVQSSNGIGASGSTVTTTALTGDFTNASATVLNVAGGANIPNGTQLGGLTGIANGVYLLSGAGTTTWTLSSAFTGTTGTALAFTARPSVMGNVVANNLIHVTVQSVNPGTSTGIQMNYARDSSISNNTITFDAAVTNSFGINTNNSGYLLIHANKVENSAGRGIYLVNSNDLTVKLNDIHNPSATGAGSNGIQLNGVTGTLNEISFNRVVDDRATHLMATALALNGFAGSSNTVVINNTFSGSTAAAIDGLVGCLECRGNRGYNPIGVVTVTVPASATAVASAAYDRTFYVTASTSTVTMAIQNGPSPVIPASGFASIRVPAGKTVTPTYTVAPTWVVEGE